LSQGAKKNPWSRKQKKSLHKEGRLRDNGKKRPTGTTRLARKTSLNSSSRASPKKKNRFNERHRRGHGKGIASVAFQTKKRRNVMKNHIVGKRKYEYLGKKEKAVRRITIGLVTFRKGVLPIQHGTHFKHREGRKSRAPSGGHWWNKGRVQWGTNKKP